MDITPGDLDKKKVDQILSGPDWGLIKNRGTSILRFGPYGPYVQLGNIRGKAKPRRALQKS